MTTPQSPLSLRLVLLMAAIFTGFTALTACSFKDGEGDKDQNGEILRQLQQARSDIAPIKGNWSGTLMRGTTEIPIELTIDTREVEVGRTTTGQSIQRVDPIATLRSSIDSNYTYSFVGTYYKETGDILFSNPDAKNADDFAGMSLVFHNDMITGDVRAQSYKVGTITLTHDGTTNGGNAVDEEQRRYDLDKANFEAIAGSWTGHVVAEAGTPLEYDVHIILTIGYEHQQSGRDKPYLIGVYTRSDQDPTSFHKTLSVNYVTRNVHRTITMTNQQSAPQQGGGQVGTNPNQPLPPASNVYTVSIDGRFAPKADGTDDLTHIVGTHMSLNQGIRGTLDLYKDGTRPTPPPQSQPVPPSPTPKPSPKPTPKPSPKPPSKPPRRD